VFGPIRRLPGRGNARGFGLHAGQWKIVFVMLGGFVSLASGIIGRPHAGQLGICELAGVLMSSSSTGTKNLTAHRALLKQITDK
jgi:hypothetical protein